MATVDDDPEVVRTGIRMPAAFVRVLRAELALRGESMQGVIEAALWGWLADNAQTPAGEAMAATRGAQPPRRGRGRPRKGGE